MTVSAPVTLKSVWRTEDGDYCTVVAITHSQATNDAVWAWVKPCTANGHVRGKPSAVQTNLAWFDVWTEVGR